MPNFKYKLKEDFEVGKSSIKNDIKSTVTNVDPTTGAITWDIKQLPSIQKAFKEFDDLRKVIKKLDIQLKDPYISNITDNVLLLFNKYRTYIRKNYPDLYKKVNEMSLSTGSGEYSPKIKTNMYKYKLKENDEEQDQELENSVKGKKAFQNERIEAFDEIEKRLDILKKELRQAKLKTISYYNKNDNYSVVYSTDIITDYLNDIENLLKDEN